jgi:glycosyltransferase involved in cell wall biosynthesis
VVATTHAALLHPSLSGIGAEFKDVEFHFIAHVNERYGITSGPLQLARRELAYWRSFKKAVREVCIRYPVDRIILPYVDYCFHSLALFGAPFGGIPWCAISMRLAVSPSDSGAGPEMSLKWRMAKRILGGRTLKALFVINPSVEDIPLDWWPREIHSRLRYLPDPAVSAEVVSRDQSRANLGLTDDVLAVLVFGSIDHRKGAESLLAALTAQTSLDRYVVILAGKQSDDVQCKLQSPLYAELRLKKKLIVFDQFLNDLEQRAVFSAADVVWVGYRNHVFMSGVLVLAGRAGLAVVGTNEGEIGRLIKRHSLGLTVHTNEPTEIIEALHVLYDGETRAEMGKRGRRAFETHTVENFGAMVLGAFEG